MKERVHRWVAAHKRLAWVLYGLTVCIGYTILLVWLKAPVWLIVLCNLLLLLLDYVWVQSCPMTLLRQAEKAWSECGDPEPLMQETTWQLSLDISEYHRQVLLVDQGVARRALGEYEKTYDILKAINIDKCAEATLPLKVIYYNNLADICMLTNRIDEVKIWHEKMTLLYQDLPPKIKQRMEPILCNARATERYSAQDYAETIRLLDELPRPEEISAAVDRMLLYAKACIALGDIETAKQKLNWVIFNGNKLYAVQEARNLLATL